LYLAKGLTDITVKQITEIGGVGLFFSGTLAFDGDGDFFLTLLLLLWCPAWLHKGCFTHSVASLVRFLLAKKTPYIEIYYLFR